MSPDPDLNRWLTTFLWMSLVAAVAVGCVVQPTQREQRVVQSQLDLGGAYLEREQFELAQHHFQRALEQATVESRQWQQAHYGLALLSLRRDQEKQAEYHFQQALRGAPYPEAENGVGVLLCRQGEWQQADRHFEKAVQDVGYKTPEIAKNNRELCGEIK